jgi:Asparagine synthase (glutamine-hydrolyzing)
MYTGKMSAFIGSVHHDVILDNKKVAESLREAARARDLPGMADVDSSLLLFCREIKKEQTVCVSGECADELFGGYPWYHNPDILYKDEFPWSNSTPLREKLFYPEALGKGSAEFVRAEYKKTINFTDCLDSDDRLGRRMREMFMLNFYWFMQTLLDRKDRMSMYNGLEVRVPYCDHRLAEYAFNMPWEIKSLNGREKGVLREAFKDLLPREIIERKKSPYPKTFNPSFLEYCKKEASLLVEDKSSVLSEIVDKEFFKALSEGKVALENPWYGQLMRIPQIFAYLIQIDEIFRTFGLKII